MMYRLWIHGRTRGWHNERDNSPGFLERLVAYVAKLQKRKHDVVIEVRERVY